MGPDTSDAVPSLALVRLEQLGWVSTSETGRRVKVYALTRAGRKQLQVEEAEWRLAAGIVDRFFSISEDLS